MIDEAQKFNVSSDDSTTLKSFGNSKEWEVLKRVVESGMLKWTSNLLVGTETELGMGAKQLESLRGFIYYWNKIKTVIQDKNYEQESKENSG